MIFEINHEIKDEEETYLLQGEIYLSSTMENPFIAVTPVFKKGVIQEGVVDIIHRDYGSVTVKGNLKELGELLIQSKEGKNGSTPGFKR